MFKFWSLCHHLLLKNEFYLLIHFPAISFPNLDIHPSIPLYTIVILGAIQRIQNAFNNTLFFFFFKSWIWGQNFLNFHGIKWSIFLANSWVEIDSSPGLYYRLLLSSSSVVLNAIGTLGYTLCFILHLTHITYWVNQYSQGLFHFTTWTTLGFFFFHWLISKLSNKT